MSESPELGQVLFGQPTGSHGTPDWVDSMITGIMAQLERVFWNINQQQYFREDADIGTVHIRAYRYDDDVDAGPNFWVEGDPQEIRWYKYPGRGQSCKLEYTWEQWAAWHDKVIAGLRAADHAARS